MSSEATIYSPNQTVRRETNVLFGRKSLWTNSGRDEPKIKSQRAYHRPIVSWRNARETNYSGIIGEHLYEMWPSEAPTCVSKCIFPLAYRGFGPRGQPASYTSWNFPFKRAYQQRGTRRSAGSFAMRYIYKASVER